MQSLEREPLLASGRRTYGEFSGLDRLNALVDFESTTSSGSASYEDEDIRITLGRFLCCQRELCFIEKMDKKKHVDWSCPGSSLTAWLNNWSKGVKGGFLLRSKILTSDWSGKVNGHRTAALLHLKQSLRTENWTKTVEWNFCQFASVLEMFSFAKWRLPSVPQGSGVVLLSDYMRLLHGSYCSKQEISGSYFCFV